MTDLCPRESLSYKKAILKQRKLHSRFEQQQKEEMNSIFNFYGPYKLPINSLNQYMYYLVYGKLFFRKMDKRWIQ